MSLRSEIKWNAIVHLKKPVEHSLEISVFELDAVVPSIHKYLSIKYPSDKGYGEFDVSVNNTPLPNWRYDQGSHSLLIPIDEVRRIAASSSCQILVQFIETNAVTRLGDSYLYTVEYDISKLFQTSFKMMISCPDLRKGWQERLYRVLATLLRIRQVPKVVPVDKEPVESSEEQIRCDFYFNPSESLSFRILYNPGHFEIVSVVLGLVGGLVIGVIANLIYSAMRGS